METVFNAPPEPQSQRQRKISDSQALLNGVRKLSTVHVPSFEPLPESGSNAGTRSSNSVDSNTNLRLRIPTVQPSNNVKDGIPLGAYANPAYSHLDVSKTTITMFFRISAEIFLTCASNEFSPWRLFGLIRPKSKWLERTPTRLVFI